MGVLKRRSRMINFRLSEDEYENLKNFCIARQARSISDLARDAVCRLISADPAKAPNGDLAEMMEKLNGRVNELDREVKRLSRLVVEAGRSRRKPEGLETSKTRRGDGETEQEIRYVEN